MPSAIGKIKNWLFNKKGKSIKENAQSFPEVFGTPTKMQRSIEQDGTESLGLNFQIKSGSPRRKISEHSSFAPRELILVQTRFINVLLDVNASGGICNFLS